MFIFSIRPNSNRTANCTHNWNLLFLSKKKWIFALKRTLNDWEVERTIFLITRKKKPAANQIIFFFYFGILPWIKFTAYRTFFFCLLLLNLVRLTIRFATYEFRYEWARNQKNYSYFPWLLNWMANEIE